MPGKLADPAERARVGHTGVVDSSLSPRSPIIFDGDDRAADRLDWSNDFDDFDAADWESYLGGPDDDEIEAFQDRLLDYGDD